MHSQSVLRPVRCFLRSGGLGRFGWKIGMKAHIVVYADSGLVHTVVAASSNVSDVEQAHALLHGDEKHVSVDSGYQGVEKRPENEGLKGVEFIIAAHPGEVRRISHDGLYELTEKPERAKASLRSIHAVRTGESVSGASQIADNRVQCALI